ncbi:MAG: hypothetical protein JST54_14225 [Deltaproteobacteria bacterium]|nr:hypothetical protein [Deltaproteobacteria bacterium]
MLLTVHDHALPDAEFRALWKQLRAVGNERLRQGYWTTFWYDFGPPRNAVDRAVLRLRERFGGWDAKGVEWWLGRTDLRRVPIELHADRDNHLFDDTGQLRHPNQSSVLYFNRVKGGALMVLDQKQSRDLKRLIPATARDWALAAPRPNRFVHFPGDRVHAVLDANNELPSKPLKGPPTPIRWALVVNWWRRRPRRVPEWDGRIYPALALPPVP